MDFKDEIKRSSIKSLNQKINNLKDKICKIDIILNARPLSEIIELRKEFSDMLKENPSVEQRTSDEFLARLEELSKIESYWRVIMEKQKNTIKLINDKVKYELMIGEYKRELFFLTS
jgi:di/tripeptidase